MKLLDATLERLSASGISLKNTFSVHTGRYMVQDGGEGSQGELMSRAERTGGDSVTIP